MKSDAPLEIGGPGRSLGFHLTSAESVTRAIFARAVGRPMNIRATELSLVCENDGIGPAQLASGLGVSRPRVSRCLDFLHRRQMLERRLSSIDGRGQHLHATAAGGRW